MGFAQRIRLALALAGDYLDGLVHHRPAEAESATDTEFSAEVVRIVQVQDHPNGDRLSIAHFAMASDPGSAAGYPVVIQRGQFAVNDLACYFSVDAIVPTGHPLFSFLKQRPDGAGKGLYRLRAARIRGVYSQGLLTPAMGLPFGTPVAERLGITYYRRPEPGTPFPQSVKVPKVQPIQVYAVDSLKKLPSLFTPGEIVHATEKIHGTNFRFGWIPRKFLGITFGHRFVYGSHRVMKDADAHPGFYGEDVWAAAEEKYDLRGRTEDYPGIVFYGELYGFTDSGKPIQDLTYGRSTKSGPGLRIFEVVEHSGQRRVPLDTRRAIVEEMGLKSVPLVFSGPYQPDVLLLANGQSLLTTEKHIREGIVIEAAEPDDGEVNPRKAKFVGEQYHLRKGDE